MGCRLGWRCVEFGGEGYIDGGGVWMGRWVRFYSVGCSLFCLFWLGDSTTAESNPQNGHNGDDGADENHNGNDEAKQACLLLTEDDFQLDNLSNNRQLPSSPWIPRRLCLCLLEGIP